MSIETNTATEHVEKRAPQSERVAYVFDHGHGVTDVIRTTIAGREVVVSAPLTDEERQRVAEAIRAVNPVVKCCYANALQVWEYDSAFDYAEGFAATDDTPDFGFPHAWNMLNGKLIDVTIDFDDYHGAVFSDDQLLSRYYDIGVEADVWGIIGNHHDRFAFLHEEGYY